MMCIVFKLNMCLGCNGFEEDIDKVKQYCDTYKKFYRKGAINERTGNTGSNERLEFRE